MSSSYDIVKSLVYTEKGSIQAEMGKYIFWVDNKANKIQIAGAVEKIYKVKVKSVNTMIVNGKWKRVVQKAGKTADWKKAATQRTVTQAAPRQPGRCVAVCLPSQARSAIRSGGRAGAWPSTQRRAHGRTMCSAFPTFRGQPVYRASPQMRARPTHRSRR